MVAFEFLGISVYWYGIFYAISFVFGYLCLWWIGKQRRFAKFPKVQYFLTQGLEDLLLAIAIGVIFWGRLGHVLIYGNGYYFTHLTEIFKVWEGGMSFIWGILGVVASVALLLAFKKMTWKDFLLLFDVILLIVPLGIFFGRFGNFLNQELYGIAIHQLPSRLWAFFQQVGLAHIYAQVDQVLRVNTNFLSMLLEGLTLFGIQVFCFFSQIKQKKRKIWLLSTNFLWVYSIIRFGLEFLRADSQMEIIGFLSKSQRFFLLFIFIAIRIRRKYVHEESL